MKPIPANFIDDFPLDLGEEYQPLRRALKEVFHSMFWANMR
jgi:hypothetical protein